MRPLALTPLIAVLTLVALPASAVGPAASACNPPLVSWQPPATWNPTGESGPTAFSRAGFSDTALSDISNPLPFVAVAACRRYDSRTDSSLPNNTPRPVTLSGGS